MCSITCGRIEESSRSMPPRPSSSGGAVIFNRALTEAPHCRPRYSRSSASLAWSCTSTTIVRARGDWARRTLDELFSDHIQPSDRTLLKLDIEGHEIEALRGASELLQRVEVVTAKSHGHIHTSQPGSTPFMAE